MQYISLVRYENWPVDGCVSVCLVLTINVYVKTLTTIPPPTGQNKHYGIETTSCPCFLFLNKESFRVGLEQHERRYRVADEDRRRGRDPATLEGRERSTASQLSPIHSRAAQKSRKPTAIASGE